jgi:hypothetical protein
MALEVDARSPGADRKNRISSPGDESGMSDYKKVVIIAGPNGAGKTTFARDIRRVDFWQWYDNSGPRPRLLKEGAN